MIPENTTPEDGTAGCSARPADAAVRAGTASPRKPDRDTIQTRAQSTPAGDLISRAAAIDAAEGSRLLDQTGEPEDKGFEDGISEAQAAIRALPASQAQGEEGAPVSADKAKDGDAGTCASCGAPGHYCFGGPDASDWIGATDGWACCHVCYRSAPVSAGVDLQARGSILLRDGRGYVDFGAPPPAWADGEGGEG